MMRRRLALVAVTGTALTVMALGMALSASARQDILRTVHSVNARFHSVEQAEKAGYVPFYVCAEQPGVGTMGQHYVKFALVGDPRDRPAQPRGPGVRAAGRWQPGAGGPGVGPGGSRGGDRPDGAWSTAALPARAEPLRHRARILRAPLLALQRQPGGRLRGLESHGVVSRHRRQRRLISAGHRRHQAPAAVLARHELDTERARTVAAVAATITSQPSAEADDPR